MCERCFVNGAKREGESHKLVITPVAVDFSRNPWVVGDYHRRLKEPEEVQLLATGRVQAMACDICDGQIVQGCFYRELAAHTPSLLLTTIQIWRVVHLPNTPWSQTAATAAATVPIYAIRATSVEFAARARYTTALQFYFADALDHSCLSNIWPVACQRRSQGSFPHEMKGRINCSLCGNLFNDDACFWTSTTTLKFVDHVIEKEEAATIATIF
ncbi:hypothetical protein GGTG_12251 [Gaeumannomyces tritici R3-111a-1]|uniref:Uncharacterized protein n=1 Tax=Gaeumannomyces tritici (strain R3-111a-1) TaxID=644352 RepID=J3PFH6_GAET3|nr:hypothetical protein GGTG_12251 [Gaeumannomyces tritici R3-111a-1]EJT70078.1 hypothetical protein GGTG_12251 [Gaeumannomyces tritici R3-111a-1]